MGCLLGGAAMSCSDPVSVTRGVGPIVQERRLLRPIDAIHVVGGMDISIHVGEGDGDPMPATSSGPETLVWIDAPEDLIPLVVVETKGSVLHVGTKDGARLDPVPTLEVFTGRLLSVNAEGTGEVRLDMDLPEGASLPELALLSKGAVDFEAKGRVRRLVVEQSGAGDMHLDHLAASMAEIDTSGSGDVWAHATGTVKVVLKGACDLYLSGAATVEEQVVLGSGAVHRSAKAPGQ